MTDASQSGASELLAFVDDEINAPVVADIRAAVAEAANGRIWSISPPEFLDDIDNGRTVGVLLQLPPTRDEHGQPLAVDLDAASLDDTKALLALLAPISGRRHVDITFELDGDLVGCMLNGEPDRSLAVGLVEAWEAHIKAARSAE